MVQFLRFRLSNLGRIRRSWQKQIYIGLLLYDDFICHPTIADESTNILLNFTMLFNAIDTYINTCVDCSPCPANVFSDVVMCLTTSCVYGTLYQQLVVRSSMSTHWVTFSRDTSAVVRGQVNNNNRLHTEAEEVVVGSCRENLMFYCGVVVCCVVGAVRLG